MSVLQVKNLTTRILLGERAYSVVDSVSFTLEKKKTVALVGESGSGKTLTALSLMRILPSRAFLGSSGEVLFSGKNLLSLPEKEMASVRGRLISMVFQDPQSSLNPVYTIGAQLFEVVSAHLDLEEDEAYELVSEGLKGVGLSDIDTLLDTYPHLLSGGMKQRVMIAMSLLCKPEVVIFDEPTTALDVTIQAQVLELIKDLQKKHGIAILFITHDLGVVAEMADRVAVMYASEVVEEAESKDLFAKPYHPYTEALFASRTLLEGETKRFQSVGGAPPSLDSYPKGCRFQNRCPYVMEKCRKEHPPLYALGDVKVRCFLYEKEGVV